MLPASHCGFEALGNAAGVTEFYIKLNLNSPFVADGYCIGQHSIENGGVWI